MKQVYRHRQEERSRSRESDVFIAAFVLWLTWFVLSHYEQIFKFLFTIDERIIPCL